MLWLVAMMLLALVLAGAVTAYVAYPPPRPPAADGPGPR